MAEPRVSPVERRMSDVEALMWNLEKDPYLASSFANVTVLDQAPDVEGLRRRLAAAVHRVPRLRQRVVPAVGRLAPPEWHDDPEFDINYHVRRIALPAPGTERQLFDLASLLASTPLDRTRPLWEFTVIEGLEGGRAALFQKIHHTVMDGESGVRMSVEFLDVERFPAEPEPAKDVSSTDGASEGEDSDGGGGFVATALETATHNLRRQLGVTRRALSGAASLVRHPERIPAVGTDVVAGAQSLLRQMAVTDSAHSSLWTERSLRRRFEVLRLPLDDTKRAAKALGGSINDLFVAGAVAGAGKYHRAKGADVDELRITMPVSTRTKGSTDANAFTPTRVLLPAGDLDPETRMTTIRERLGTTKGERAIGLASSLAGVMNVLPTSVLVRFARQQVETVDFATSNVRGAPFNLYIAGALIEANYPMGPTGGTAFNLTLLSSGGSLDMGCNIDVAAIDDPDLLRRCLEDSYAELLAFA
ncbi:MAG: diacylglycerol O-acyltransferase / wax synthase [Acidimicrobiaceae bacterium]